MFELNGRVGKDKAGKPTSKNNSVVDYAINSTHLLRKVEDFEILEFSKLFSDIHFPVSLTMSCVKPEDNYDVPQENAERIGRWKFQKGVEFNGNVDKNRIEHLFFNLLKFLKVNNYARKLISFCKNNNMLELNGRVGKD